MSETTDDAAKLAEEVDELLGMVPHRALIDGRVGRELHLIWRLREVIDAQAERIREAENADYAHQGQWTASYYKALDERDTLAADLEQSRVYAKWLHEKEERHEATIHSLAAQIEKAREATKRGNLVTPPWVIEALSADPADILREHDAEVLEAAAADIYVGMWSAVESTNATAAAESWLRERAASTREGKN